MTPTESLALIDAAKAALAAAVEVEQQARAQLMAAVDARQQAEQKVAAEVAKEWIRTARASLPRPPDGIEQYRSGGRDEWDTRPYSNLTKRRVTVLESLTPGGGVRLLHRQQDRSTPLVFVEVRETVTGRRAAEWHAAFARVKS